MTCRTGESLESACWSWRPVLGDGESTATAGSGVGDSATKETLDDVAWGGNDNVGTVVHSRDGDRWELASDHEYLAYEDFEAIAWNGERFVAVSNFQWHDHVQQRRRPVGAGPRDGHPRSAA